MMKYPGLGLPLRDTDDFESSFYPMGIHRRCDREYDLLTVREVAMMNIMDRLTDKEDWHKKVFDEQIVAKWREEALSIPDQEYWNLAAGGKIKPYENSHWTDDYHEDDPYLEPLEGIMSETAFNCVSSAS